MKQYILKHFGVFKIILSLFLTIGCNISIEGHFWPNEILTYIFLVLNAFIVSRIDLDGLSLIVLRDRIKIYTILITVFSIVVQGIILRVYQVDSMVVFVKTVIKVLIAGGATAFILGLYFSGIINRVEEKRRPDILFVLFSIAGLIYFYFIRITTDNFSIYSFILLMMVYLVKIDTESETGDAYKSNLPTKAGAVLLALFETLGHMATTYWSYNGGFLQWLMLLLIGVVVWSFIFYYVLRALFVMLDKILWNSEKRYSTGEIKDYNANKITIVMLVITVGIRLLYWLNWFPALLSKDTYLQIQQALGNEAYSNHHPWLHTMVIKLCMSAGRLVFGSNQAAIAVTAFASLVVSGIIIVLILRYYNNITPSKVWWLAAMIFAVDPIHCVYSITIWKDVMFAYALLAFCFLLMVMDDHVKYDGRVKPQLWCLYVAVSFIFCFSRTNGLYAWIFTLPFLLWHYRKNIKPWIISTVICLLLIAGYKGWILPHFQVTEPDMVESLSVPLQQVAFTIRSDGCFSENDIAVINNIVDMESLGKRYDSHISDPVKNLIRDYGNQEYITQNKIEFIKMYISVGLKNPVEYIVAFLNQSKGYWYQKMSNYIYFSEGVHSLAAELGIHRAPLLPVGISSLSDKLMDKYCDVWHALWSLALSTYVVLILFVYSLARKRTCFYFLPIIGVLITLVIATPVNDEFRYAYGIYLSLPLLLMESASNCNYHKERHE